MGKHKILASLRPYLPYLRGLLIGVLASALLFGALYFAPSLLAGRLAGAHQQAIAQATITATPAPQWQTIDRQYGASGVTQARSVVTLSGRAWRVILECSSSATDIPTEEALSLTVYVGAIPVHPSLLQQVAQMVASATYHGGCGTGATGRVLLTGSWGGDVSAQYTLVWSASGPWALLAQQEEVA